MIEDLKGKVVLGTGAPAGIGVIGCKVVVHNS